MKSTIVWHVTLCTMAEANRRFGETSCYHLQELRVSRSVSKHNVAFRKAVLIIVTAVRIQSHTVNYEYAALPTWFIEVVYLQDSPV